MLILRRHLHTFLLLFVALPYLSNVAGNCGISFKRSQFENSRFLGSDNRWHRGSPTDTCKMNTIIELEYRIEVS
jgi:hypothetical protein